MNYYKVEFYDKISKMFESIIVKVDEFLGVDETEVEYDLINDGYDPEELETQEITLIESKRIENDNYNCYWV